MKKKQAKKPVAVILSDLHMCLKFIEPATASLDQAIMFANELNLPLICAGDFHDTKAIHREECIEVSRELLRKARIKPILLVGNHDRVNEKSEKHALHAYDELAEIVNQACSRHGIGLIPYHHDKEKFLESLELIRSDMQLIVHQGVAGAKMGEYVTDRSQVDAAVFDRFTKRVYSGHYHCNQSIGNLTYFGTPFTTSFAEANDGPKGFWVMFNDGTIELQELKLRRHVVIETKVAGIPHIGKFPPETLLWIKLHGSSKELSMIKKADLGEKVLGHSNFRLDRIKTDDVEVLEKTAEGQSSSFTEIMEKLIANEKAHGETWKELNEAS